MTSLCRFYLNKIQEVILLSFKIFRFNCCGPDVHKARIYACIDITDSNGRTDYKQARLSSFFKGLKELRDWLAKYNCSEVRMESIGKYWIPVFSVPEKANNSVILAHPKYTKSQKGNKTDRKDAKWICDLLMCEMIKPSSIPPADIRHLRDLVRYRFKLTCMTTGEKNRAQNCLTVSNLKLDDVFSDVFGKSSHSITEYMLVHPGEISDVTPFVDSRCKTPMEEIQVTVNGAISPEQAIKLRRCLSHIDELEKHLEEMEREIPRLSDKYQAALGLIRTAPGLDKNPMATIQILSEIGGDMSVFPSAEHLVSWVGRCPRNDQSNKRIKSIRTPCVGDYIKPILVQVANDLLCPKKHPEITGRYKRIKSHRGHKKAIIAICRMLLTAIWHILSDLKPYTAEGLLESRSANKAKVLITSQALNLLRQRGYTIRDDIAPAMN